MTLYLASGNVHKKEELKTVLFRHTILLPGEAGIPAFEAEETGLTFAENALIKARSLFALLEKRGAAGPVLADDSGLCVDALNGRPGVYSARYGSNGGKKLEPADRNALLLDEVNATHTGNGSRRCRFVCAMALLSAPGRFCLAQETLEGELVTDISAARGNRGFGYDPIVLLPELGLTVAELSETEKNTLSHRGKAARALAKLLD